MPPSPALVLKAEANKHEVIKLLQCSDVDFEAFESSTVAPKTRKKVWYVLKLDDSEIASLDLPTGVVQTMRGLRPNPNPKPKP